MIDGPGNFTLFMVGLLYLKYTDKLFEEKRSVVAASAPQNTISRNGTLLGIINLPEIF